MLSIWSYNATTCPMSQYEAELDYESEMERKQKQCKEGFIVIRTYYKHAEMTYQYFYSPEDLST